MQWNSLAEFLDMGGYAFYVWGSFGATAVCMGIELWLLRQRRRVLEQSLRDEFAISTTSGGAQS